jgi:hypothetical protein
MLIRPAVHDDYDAMWAILEPVLRAGETYALTRDIGHDEVFAYWNGAGVKGSWLRKEGGLSVGTLPRAFGYPQLGFVDAFVDVQGVPSKLLADTAGRERREPTRRRCYGRNESGSASHSPS